MIRLTVRVTPRGGRDAVDGWMQDPEGRAVLKLRVAAAPTEGLANAAVIALLAKTLKLPRSAVRLTAGDTARVKRLEIDAEAVDLVQALGNPPGDRLL